MSEETQATPSERLELGSEGNQSDLLSVLPGETGFEDVQARKRDANEWVENELAVRGLGMDSRQELYAEWLETHWSQKEE